jgi:hypothetical protein
LTENKALAQIDMLFIDRAQNESATEFHVPLFLGRCAAGVISAITFNQPNFPVFPLSASHMNTNDIGQTQYSKLIFLTSTLSFFMFFLLNVSLELTYFPDYLLMTKGKNSELNALFKI